MNESLTDRASAALAAVREKHPLVHNITNYVVMNVTANALLAIGAAPVMAHAVDEVEEMAGIAGALVLNIGTLSPPWIEAMFRAGRAARARGIPIVLDPVGAGATRLRTDSARRLLDEIRPAIVRGNASEILALTGDEFRARGVDSMHPVAQARAAAADLARRFAVVVAVTGAEDFVTDGRRAARISNGHPLMGRITGSGCTASALTGAFAAVAEDAFTAAAATLAVFGICGELAAVGDPGPGTYQVRLLDALSAVQPEDVARRARVAVDAA
jgi:hydroxyethylthiazole kinase